MRGQLLLQRRDGEDRRGRRQMMWRSTAGQGRDRARAAGRCGLLSIPRGSPQWPRSTVLYAATRRAQFHWRLGRRRITAPRAPRNQRCPRSCLILLAVRPPLPAAPSCRDCFLLPDAAALRVIRRSLAPSLAPALLKICRLAMLALLAFSAEQAAPLVAELPATGSRCRGHICAFQHRDGNGPRREGQLPWSTQGRTP